jgi:hypothetical protein
MPWPQRDELTPAQPGLDLGEHQRQKSIRDALEESLELLRCRDVPLLGDHLGQLGVGARAVRDDAVAHCSLEYSMQHDVVLHDAAR